LDSRNSDKKRDANRRNANLSTGPKSPGGKARSSKNATKTGIWAKDCVITGEDPAEWTQDRQRFFELWRPKGPHETSWVEVLFDIHWRRRRASRTEAGEIRRRVLAVRDALPLERKARARELLEVLDDDELEELNQRDAARDELARMSPGIEEFQERLARAIREVDMDGALAEETEEIIENAFGRAFGRRCGALNGKAQSAAPDTAARDELLKVLREQQAELADQKQRAQRRERRVLQAAQAARSLPDTKRCDLISRYETTMDRRELRITRELERLQTVRRARRDADGADEGADYNVWDTYPQE
jgi:hypothetical protein